MRGLECLDHHSVEYGPYENINYRVLVFYNLEAADLLAAG